jgi:hypothetical protein
MKQFGNFIFNFFQPVLDFIDMYGRAKAASELASLGRYEEALRIMEKDKEVHP